MVWSKDIGLISMSKRSHQYFNDIIKIIVLIKKLCLKNIFLKCFILISRINENFFVEIFFLFYLKVRFLFKISIQYFVSAKIKCV